MKLGYFSMPLHPPTRDYAEVLKEDREAAVLADGLGFSEAYFGEHATDPSERVTSSLMFLASLANITKRMKLGCGTINLPNGHPANFAVQIAMLDHILEGRFILGISAGALLSDAEVFGVLDNDRNAMFLECIDQILEIWRRDPPYAIEGAFWNISTGRTMDPETMLGEMPKPYQKPHPEIVCAALAPFSIGVAKAAARGWHPISSNFLQPAGIASHWTRYLEGCEQGGYVADHRNWRVARKIFVTDDEKTALRYAKSQEGPYAFMVNQIYKKLLKGERLGSMKEHPEQPDHEITPDFALESLVIAGTPNSVTDQILKFRDTVGDFGTLVYAGVDWQDPTLARRSMELMVTDVMPAVNKAIGAPAAA
jgi:alkanesulfonate monooxygenase SsuD/methylene tetrahydromethanopterin reductase-like flavin-dependent oxidoreductase (luciferase family)